MKVTAEEAFDHSPRATKVIYFSQPAAEAMFSPSMTEHTAKEHAVSPTVPSLPKATKLRRLS